MTQTTQPHPNPYVDALVIGFRHYRTKETNQDVLAGIYAVERENGGLEQREVSHWHDSDPEIGPFMNGGLSFLIAAVIEPTALKPLYDALRARQHAEAVMHLRNLLKYSGNTGEAFASGDTEQIAQRVQTLNETLGGKIIKAQFYVRRTRPDEKNPNRQFHDYAISNYDTRRPDSLPRDPLPFVTSSKAGQPTFGGIDIASILAEFAEKGQQPGWRLGGNLSPEQITDAAALALEGLELPGIDAGPAKPAAPAPAAKPAAAPAGTRTTAKL